MQELIAPRPVRLAFTPFGVSAGPRRHSASLRRISSPPIEALAARIKLSDEDAPDAQEDQPSSPGLEPYMAPSPRFNAEALEEFLSILRPTFFSPMSPISRCRRGHAQSSSLALPSHSYERPHPYKIRDKSRSASSSNSSASDELDLKRARASESRGEKSDGSDLGGDLDAWQASMLLASPISRNQTRNPLPRDPYYEAMMSHNLAFRVVRTPTPAPLPSPIHVAAGATPSEAPTPAVDEMETAP